MQIKNVRNPNEEEKKNIIPKLIYFGVITAIMTGVVYLMTFHYKDIGESMYLTGKIASTTTAAENDLIIKLFETIYGRDYMVNKFEGVPVSFLISIIAETIVGLLYKIHPSIKGAK